MAGEEVDRQLEFRVLVVELADLLARLAHDLAGHLENVAGGLGEGHEGAGRDDRAVGPGPTHQHLAAAQPAGLDVHHRLVVGHELALADRLDELVLRLALWPPGEPDADGDEEDGEADAGDRRDHLEIAHQVVGGGGRRRDGGQHRVFRRGDLDDELALAGARIEMAELARAQPDDAVAEPQLDMAMGAQVIGTGIDGDGDRRDLGEQPAAVADAPADQRDAGALVDAVAHADADEGRIRLQHRQHRLAAARLVRHVAHQHAAGVDDADQLDEGRLDQAGVKGGAVGPGTGDEPVLVQPLEDGDGLADGLLGAHHIALGHRLHLGFGLCYGIVVEDVVGRDKGRDRQAQGDRERLQEAGIAVRHANIRH
jgi:hypothetical protein